MDETKLIKQLKQRKRDALKIVIKQYTPYVRVIVYNVIGGSMAAEDIEETIADVFISLWNYSENLNESKGEIRSYIGSIARNNAKNKLRSKKELLPLNTEITASMSEQPDRKVEDDEQKKLLWRMVEELGEPDSEIFLRYYYYDEKIREISRNTGLNASTVKTKLARGRQKLKEKIMSKRRNGYE